MRTARTSGSISLAGGCIEGGAPVRRRGFRSDGTRGRPAQGGQGLRPSKRRRKRLGPIAPKLSQSPSRSRRTKGWGRTLSRPRGKRAWGFLAKSRDVSRRGHQGESRACGMCGAPFKVNPRHARVHRFCTAACRSKHRRRLNPGRGHDGLACDRDEPAALAASRDAPVLL
jgi:hypothetical protein